MGKSMLHAERVKRLDRERRERFGCEDGIGIEGTASRRVRKNRYTVRTGRSERRFDCNAGKGERVQVRESDTRGWRNVCTRARSTKMARGKGR